MNIIKSSEMFPPVNGLVLFCRMNDINITTGTSTNKQRTIPEGHENQKTTVTVFKSQPLTPHLNRQMGDLCPHRFIQRMHKWIFPPLL